MSKKKKTNQCTIYKDGESGDYYTINHDSILEKRWKRKKIIREYEDAIEFDETWIVFWGLNIVWKII
jgi:hypothetical protein